MADPFDTLALEARLRLTGAEIEQAYLRRAGGLHPDLADPDKQADAARAMAALNDARRVLSDQERRANALLARLGGPNKEQDNALPPMFLMEIMETREAVEQARDSGDPDELKKWGAWAQEQREMYFERVAELFDSFDSSKDDGVLTEIRAQLNCWRYIERLIEQLDPAYDPNRADFT